MMFTLSILVIHLLSAVDSCSCIGKSMQSIFCESDFVALVTVVNETLVADKPTTEAPIDEDYPNGVPQLSFSLYISDDDIEGTYYYDVNVEHLYVGSYYTWLEPSWRWSTFSYINSSSRSALHKEKARLKTDADPGLCGLRLTVGKKQLVTAKIDSRDGHLTLSSCNAIHEDFEKFTEFQRIALDKLYKRSCNCKPAMNIMCEEGHFCTNADECALLPSDGDKSCYNRYSVCTKSMYGRCEWLRSKKFKECLTGTLKGGKKNSGISRRS